MKLFIFSDAHGYLHNVRGFLSSNDYDNRIFCGDLFGYLPISENLLNKFYKNNICKVIGNHDLYFLRKINLNKFKYYFSKFENLMIDSESYEKKYGYLFESIEKIKHMDFDDYFKTPITIKLIIDSIKIVICHGSPESPFDYLYQDYDNINYIIEKYDFDILVVGNTHKPYVKKIGDKYIINPGSCTLPRKGFSSPSIITIVTRPLEIHIHYLSQKLKYKINNKNKIVLSG